MNKKHGAWSKNEKIFLGLLAPILVLFFCFNTLPLIKGFYYGLTNFRGYGSYDFVGLRNFADALVEIKGMEHTREISTVIRVY